jgi:hypothetical protein
MIDRNSLNASVPEALASLEKKLQVIRDLVTGVAMLFKFGLFLFGGGGIGKSYTVLDQLRRLNVPYVLRNTKMSGKGLYLTLENAPNAIHVLEDMERLTKDPDAQGVLRSALWAQPGHERIVTWTTAKDGEQHFVFRGGLIMISNRPLADLPVLRALATRIEVFHLEVSDAEQAARMYELASRGYQQAGKAVIGSAECLEITEHLLNECRTASCPLDLRLQQKAFQTYLQWEADMANLHWKDLVAASVREAAHHFRYEVNTMSPEAKWKQKRNIIRRLMRELPGDFQEQVKRYMKETGCSRADFYRHKAEIDSKKFDEADAA